MITVANCSKVKNPCAICNNSVSKKNGLQCQGSCKSWVHFKCLNYTPGKIQDVKKGTICVTCPCPDCKTMVPKEYRTDTPFNCKNPGCKETTPGVCPSKECFKPRPSCCPKPDPCCPPKPAKPCPPKPDPCCPKPDPCCPKPDPCCSPPPDPCCPSCSSQDQEEPICCQSDDSAASTPSLNTIKQLRDTVNQLNTKLTKICEKMANKQNG